MFKIIKIKYPELSIEDQKRLELYKEHTRNVYLASGSLTDEDRKFYSWYKNEYIKLNKELFKPKLPWIIKDWIHRRKMMKSLKRGREIEEYYLVNHLWDLERNRDNPI